MTSEINSTYTHSWKWKERRISSYSENSKVDATRCTSLQCMLKCSLSSIHSHPCCGYWNTKLTNKPSLENLNLDKERFVHLFLTFPFILWIFLSKLCCKIFDSWFLDRAKSGELQGYCGIIFFTLYSCIFFLFLFEKTDWVA